MAKTEVLGNGQRHAGLTRRIEEMPVPAPTRATAIVGASERRSTGNTANVLLLDCSGSTSDSIGKGDSNPKIEGIKEAATTFVAGLPSSAYISIIAFEDRASVLWEMGPADQKLEVIRIVQQLQAGGLTAMADALGLAEEQFRKAPNGWEKRLYDLTDGMPDKKRDASVAAERIKAAGVQVHTIGYGEGGQIDEALLQSMASVSASGKPLYYHFVEAKQLTGFLKQQTKTITT